MARPARPPEEAQAVREAAEIVRQETRLSAVSAISREIARRVTANLTTFIEQDADEPMAAALERVRFSLKPCPFHFLATDPEVNTIELFIDFRIADLVCRGGGFVSPQDRCSLLAHAMERISKTLANRYGRQLTSSE